jgi:hypothetical protein
VRNKVLLSCAIFLLSSQAMLAIVPCSELKTKIEDGMKEKGVEGFTLTVVPMSDAAEGKVVGTCEGGKNKIVYTKGEAPKPVRAEPSLKDEKKPAVKQ